MINWQDDEAAQRWDDFQLSNSHPTQAKEIP
jgi:hypothetical protein